MSFKCGTCGEEAATVTGADDIAATCHRAGTDSSDLCMHPRPRAILNRMWRELGLPRMADFDAEAYWK